MYSLARCLALGAATFWGIATSSPLTLSLEPRGLAKRDITEVICGLYSSADYFDTYHNNIDNLGAKGDQNVHVPAGACSRIAYVGLTTAAMVYPGLETLVPPHPKRHSLTLHTIDLDATTQGMAERPSL